MESYTIAIIRLNTAFGKLDDSCDMNEIKAMFEESFKDLQKVYSDIIDDLNQEEVNLNEYYLFFQNGRQTFPQYIDALGQIDNVDIQEITNKLLNVFSNLNKIAEAFSKDDLNERFI